MINGHTELERARAALSALDASCGREDWIRAGMAAKAAGLSEHDFVEWSSKGSNFAGAARTRIDWKSFKPDGDIGASTLFYMAKENGWCDEATTRRNGVQAPGALRPKPRLQAKPKAAQKPHSDLAATFEAYPTALADHPYIAAKRGIPDGLRVVPDDDSLTIRGTAVAGWLAVPVRSLDGTLRTIQYVPPPDGGDKLNAPGASFGDGLFVVGEIGTDGTVYVCEGIGQAWACAKADYYNAAAVAFGSGRVRTVAKLLRERYPAARIVIVPDRGKEADAEIIAREVSGAWVELPADKPANFDVNDFEAEHGSDVLADLLHAARVPKIEVPLSVAFADDLPKAFSPPDELVQGVITVGASSVLYGDSNCGKTFFAIDMAAAVARGINWMGKRTEPGMVLYLAAESPASVGSRLQAYQRHHGVRVPNFAIVQNSVNLFESDDDTNAIIETVRQLEEQRGQKVRLIVGDTLARMSAGANENSSDMGLVIRRFDLIRAECDAHFLLIHHCGKVAAYGMRGWSGIRAAIDTEIEITDSLSGRCAEITKQRDLSTKGERIGFRLDVVELGTTKWGSPATTCIVSPEDAPEKPTRGKRIGEVEGAVAEFLASHKVGIKKRDLAAHFEDRYRRTSVYRAVKALVEAGAAHEAAGIVCVSQRTK